MLFAAILLSLGAVDALIPLIIIFILIAAAAGSMRGYSMFNLFGIATVVGFGGVGGKGQLAKKNPGKISTTSNFKISGAIRGKGAGTGLPSKAIALAKGLKEGKLSRAGVAKANAKLSQAESMIARHMKANGSTREQAIRALQSKGQISGSMAKSMLRGTSVESAIQAQMALGKTRSEAMAFLATKKGGFLISKFDKDTEAAISKVMKSNNLSRLGAIEYLGSKSGGFSLGASTVTATASARGKVSTAINFLATRRGSAGMAAVGLIAPAAYLRRKSQKNIGNDHPAKGSERKVTNAPTGQHEPKYAKELREARTAQGMVKERNYLQQKLADMKKKDPKAELNATDAARLKFLIGTVGNYTAPVRVSQAKRAVALSPEGESQLYRRKPKSGSKQSSAQPVPITSRYSEFVPGGRGTGGPGAPAYGERTSRRTIAGPISVPKAVALPSRKEVADRYTYHLKELREYTSKTSGQKAALQGYVAGLSAIPKKDRTEAQSAELKAARQQLRSFTGTTSGQKDVLQGTIATISAIPKKDRTEAQKEELKDAKKQMGSIDSNMKRMDGLLKADQRAEKRLEGITRKPLKGIEQEAEMFNPRITILQKAVNDTRSAEKTADNRLADIGKQRTEIEHRRADSEKTAADPKASAGDRQKATNDIRSADRELTALEKRETEVYRDLNRDLSRIHDTAYGVSSTSRYAKAVGGMFSPDKEERKEARAAFKEEWNRSPADTAAVSAAFVAAWHSSRAKAAEKRGDTEAAQEHREAAAENMQKYHGEMAKRYRFSGPTGPESEGPSALKPPKSSGAHTIDAREAAMERAHELAAGGHGGGHGGHEGGPHTLSHTGTEEEAGGEEEEGGAKTKRSKKRR